MRHSLAAATVLLAAGCTPAEQAQLEQQASADFTAACNDWQSMAALAGAAGALLPPPLDEAASVTEGFVGDACTDPAFLASAGSEQVTWLKQSTLNLKAVIGSAQQRAALARLPSYGELRR
jgi:hypothetical protein